MNAMATLKLGVGLIATIGGIVFVLVGVLGGYPTLAGWGWSMLTFMLGVVFGQSPASFIKAVKALFSGRQKSGCDKPERD